ncbi:MAG: FAD-dependent oxidoreductase [Terrimicrobiaceae bacterium]
MERLAIIGTGVSGVGCAWHLRHCAEITLFDKAARPGGHTNTVVVNEDGREVPIDTGFIVFNRQTYPNLCRLFEELDVDVKPSEMSFSVQHVPSGLEYNGMGLNRLFAQRQNVFNPRFLKLIASITRFFKAANASLENSSDLTLREFVEKHRLGADFLELYLVPMSSAVWSTNPKDVLDFPAASLIRFFHNHGFLGVTTHHPWFTVTGGSRTYLQKILAAVGRPKLQANIVRVSENDKEATITTADGSVLAFDRVIMASHADQSLAMLAAPDEAQRRLLSPFRYENNQATLHTWEGVMPKKRLAWASWNYRVEKSAGEDLKPATHYWMNALQGVSKTKNYFVSLNSREQIPDEHVLYEADYEHPIFNGAAIQAQAELNDLNTRSRDQRLFFCGSYFKYGFHEDAYSSALYLSRMLEERLTS